MERPETSRNHPKPAETIRNQPKPPETSHFFSETTRNHPKPATKNIKDTETT